MRAVRGRRRWLEVAAVMFLVMGLGVGWGSPRARAGAAETAAAPAAATGSALGTASSVAAAPALAGAPLAAAAPALAGAPLGAAAAFAGGRDAAAATMPDAQPVYSAAVLAAAGQVAGPPLLPVGDAANVPVLVYHHFLPAALAKDVNSELLVTVETFTEQMRLLASEGYHTITTTQLANWLLDGGRLPEKPVLITIDDGYESQYKYAFPVLKRFNLTATLFVITGDVADKNPPYNPKVLSTLDWQELQAMAESGLIDVQAHTNHMHHLIKGRAAALSLTDAAVSDDLALNRRLIATRLGGAAPLAFAFPRGEYDDRYLRLVKKSGFRIAFSVDAHGPVRRGDNPNTLRRMGVFRNHWLGTFRKMVDGRYP